MGTTQRDLVTLAANNRLAVLPGFDRQTGIVASTPSKLRVLRGAVTSMGLLPFNQSLLIAADTGVVTMLA